MDEAPEASEDAMANALKALAHPNRLRILRFATGPRSLEEIASDLGLARQSAQVHVEQLLELGLLEPQRGRGERGPVTQYVVALPRLFEIYDRLGARVGLVDADLDEHVRSALPTTPLALQGRSPPPAHGPRLTVVHGMRVGLTVPLQGPGPWLIGRDPAAALCLDYDPFVSQRHAEVRRAPSGIELVDALSSNGVFVDWVRLPRAARIVLQNGSLVRAGRTMLLYRDNPPRSEILF